MRTLKVEILRFGRDTGTFSERYLVTVDGSPARTVEPSMDAETVIRTLDKLRYRDANAARPTPEEQKAISALRTLIAEFLVDLPELPASAQLTQLDLVTDKVELWALPFEFALARDGRELLGDSSRPVLLTRRVRRSFAEHAHPWPVRPRVLFAWSGDVQYPDHRGLLQRALEPWLGPLDHDLIPDAAPIFTELRGADLRSITEACRVAAEAKRPFTHVHILAHGALVPDLRQLESFGVMLEGEVARADAIVRALRAGAEGGPTVVTLAVCDSANAASSIVAGGRLAYELHAAGVPVVVGSQFPLTEAGAVVYARAFYASVLAHADDVRVALCKARAALRDSNLEGHDWASVTAHLSLPEGYLAQNEAQSQRLLFEQLNCATRWAQRIAESKEETPRTTAVHVEQLLEGRILALAERVAQREHRDEAIQLEDLGLLASANKRLAELVFHGPGGTARSRELLAESGRWYLEAHDRALSHHWSGTQHLAIDVATRGRSDRIVHWLSSLHAARRHAAGRDARERAWALGSLAELCLLERHLTAPVASSVSAQDTIAELIALAAPSMPDVLDSTYRQLRRYVTWWTNANGFFPETTDLAREARLLADQLERSARQ